MKKSRLAAIDTGSNFNVQTSVELGTEDILVEIFGGNTKKDLFEKAFAGNVVLI